MPISTFDAIRVGVGHTRALLRNARLHNAQPNEFTLRGVRLGLDAPWATPAVRAAIYDRAYEALEAEVLDHTLRPDDRVLEIGCGIGFIGTLSANIVGDAVRCYDANPEMVTAARDTLDRNGAAASVTLAALANSPDENTISFYVHEDFWTSSLKPDPLATEIAVPVLDFVTEIREHRASYLIIDIEGAETDLLREPLPDCVIKICVECHPGVSRPEEIAAMLASLLAQDFELRLELSRQHVLYLAR